MTRNGIHITAWGTVISAFTLAVVTFPEIAKSAENQQLEAQSTARFEALEAFADSDARMDLGYWIDSKSDDLASISQVRTSEPHGKLDLAAETHCMAEAVYYEARSETVSGQRAVAEVILNRVKSKHFPNTICDVVYEGSERSTGCQFTFTCDGSMEIAPNAKSWDRSIETANLVMSGGHTPLTNYATHYHTLQVNPKWSKTMRMTRQVGSHVFYRFAPRDYKPTEPALLVAPPI